MATTANPEPGSTINPKTGKSGNGAGSSLAPTPGSGPSPCLILVPNPVKGIPLIGDLISSAGVCLFTKTEARALIGGIMVGVGGVTMSLGLSLVVVSVLGHTSAGKAVGNVAGTTAEVAGAGLALVPGAEAAGAAVAAGGAIIKRHKGAAGNAAQGTKARRQAGQQETAELQARGASDIRTARKPRGSLGAPTHPGRIVKSERAPGRQGEQRANVSRETSRQRSARMARSSGRPATREEAGF
jgi:hypothetical protein